MSLRTVPTYEVPISRKDVTHTSWYRWMRDIDNGVPIGLEQTVTVSGSPFTYTASVGGNLLVKGGTVSAIQITRSTTVLTGMTSGFIPVSAGDQVIVTYTVLPTMVFYPS